MMSFTISEVRPGAYYDSVILMQLQRELASLPGVIDAGVVMATAANCNLLKSSGFSVDVEAKPDDLLIVIKADHEKAGKDALAQVDHLMATRRRGDTQGYLPKSLRAAEEQLPQAEWVLISVPGRYAAKVARDALDINKNVFLYSDNVTLADELALKKSARSRGLLMMGPDCGTAIINGIGFGFANRVRRGTIGLVGASGTGLQVISSEIHRLGQGITHAIGTGGRDLSGEIGAITALQGLSILGQDIATKVVVLVSKPPETSIASRLLAEAWDVGKPIVVQFIGHPVPARNMGPLFFASSLSDAAELAVELAGMPDKDKKAPTVGTAPTGQIPGYVRGLFSGGTIATEAAQALQAILGSLSSNVHLEGVRPVEDIWHSSGHTILDLGDDLFTQGRLHPMLDNDYRIRRMKQEAADPGTGVIMIDIVLGEGAHPDPASELSPAVAGILEDASREDRTLEVTAIVIGTDEDPQGLERQIKEMRDAGARVFRNTLEAVSTVVDRLENRHRESASSVTTTLSAPVAAINVGLDSFYDNLLIQGAAAVNVDWRPPAGGDEKLADLLSRMK